MSTTDTEEVSAPDAPSFADLYMQILNRDYPEDQMRAIHERFQFCCGKHHALISNVQPGEIALVEKALHYYFGGKRNRGWWWQKAWDGSYQAEVVDMTDVYPPPRYPWNWCGVTFLFDEWRTQILANERAAKQVRLGDWVSFSHKGQVYKGQIIGGRTKASVLVGHSKWSVPYSQLTKLGVNPL